MENLFWEVFKKSGDINAFMAYKEYKNKLDFNSAVDEIFVDKIKKDIH